MLSEFIKEYIGEECIISTIDDWADHKGKILDVKDGWIKFEDKKHVVLFNCEMVTTITKSRDLIQTKAKATIEPKRKIATKVIAKSKAAIKPGSTSRKTTTASKSKSPAKSAPKPAAKTPAKTTSTKSVNKAGTKSSSRKSK